MKKQIILTLLLSLGVFSFVDQYFIQRLPARSAKVCESKRTVIVQTPPIFMPDKQPPIRHPVNQKEHISNQEQLSESTQPSSVATPKQVIHPQKTESVTTREVSAITPLGKNQKAIKKAVEANHLSFLDYNLVYQNGGQTNGQAIIDSNPYQLVSTWGGKAEQSGLDGYNTHFIGHNPGVFASLLQLSLGDVVTVSDQACNVQTYQVNDIYEVDAYGVAIQNQQPYGERITGIDGGERITLQTCLTENSNLIVEAQAIHS